MKVHNENGYDLEYPVPSENVRSVKDSTLYVVARQFSRNRMAVIGLIILFLMILMAILAPVINPYDYAMVDPMHAHQLPSSEHWFGTDDLGRDIFSRITYGARYSLSIGIAACLLGAILGIVFGLIAGFFGGWVESLILRICDIVQSIPNTINADSYISRICKPIDFQVEGPHLSYGLKRICRLKGHYYLFLYKLYLEYRGRIPFETINLARIQTINVKFYNGNSEYNFDIEVFLARDAKTAKSLPWIIKREQVEMLLEKLPQAVHISDAQTEYLLKEDDLSIKLSNQKSIVLSKKSTNSVYYQIR